MNLFGAAHEHKVDTEKRAKHPFKGKPIGVHERLGERANAD
jgi:hypothetical protein